ncbi:hypothetical protein DFJ73DRAFT_14491 [Zopfochytrium polystomum]|nr:hypothetical protein DFJ73DRAFT_14491 [Zopfochytrium polystomum]
MSLLRFSVLFKVVACSGLLLGCRVTAFLVSQVLSLPPLTTPLRTARKTFSASSHHLTMLTCLLLSSAGIVPAANQKTPNCRLLFVRFFFHSFFFFFLNFFVSLFRHRCCCLSSTPSLFPFFFAPQR